MFDWFKTVLYFCKALSYYFTLGLFFKMINFMNNSGLLTYIQLQPIMFKNKSYDAFLQGLHNQIDNLYRIKFPETSDKFMIFATIPRHVILPPCQSSRRNSVPKIDAFGHHDTHRDPEN